MPGFEDCENVINFTRSNSSTYFQIQTMMKFSAIWTIILVFFLLNTNAQSFKKVWETDAVFATPESVCYDADRSQIYVSNINGQPMIKDNNGFISLLSKDGKIKKLKWVTGMNAPKGMVIVDSLLFVTDIDRFLIIDIKTAKIIRTVSVEGASFLNDMTVDLKGNVYMTDMGKNQVLITTGLKADVWLEGNEINKPNGLAFFKGSLFVGVKDALLKINPDDKSVRVHVTETGSIDGLVPIGGNKYVISDWSGRIMLVTPTEKIVLSNTTEQKIQAADLGYIPDEKLVLIPTFFDNRVIAARLP